MSGLVNIGATRRAPIILAVWVVVGVLVLAGLLGLFRKRVTIYDSGAQIRVSTFGSLVKSAIGSAQIELNPGDEVAPRLSVKLSDGQNILVYRAFPVTIDVSGQKKVAYAVEGKTVYDVLLAAGVELGPLDKVTPDRGEPVRPGTTISVTRVTRAVMWQEDEIPYNVVRKQDHSLDQGVSKVVRRGEYGRAVAAWGLTYEGSTEKRRDRLATKVLNPPVDEVVVTGTAGTISRGGATLRYSRAISMIATAYYPGPKSTGKWADGLTATGLKAGRGIAAVDPTVIKLGSRLYVEGYGFAIAADVGSAIKGNRIDLCFDTYEEAVKWGRKKVTVYVLLD